MIDDYEHISNRIDDFVKGNEIKYYAVMHIKTAVVMARASIRYGDSKKIFLAETKKQFETVYDEVMEQENDVGSSQEKGKDNFG